MRRGEKFSVVKCLVAENCSRGGIESIHKTKMPQQVEGDPACRTLAAHGSGGTLIEIPHPPARVGCLSKRDASWLHRGSKITFVLRGYVSSLSPQGSLSTRGSRCHTNRERVRSWPYKHSVGSAVLVITRKRIYD